jgi:hypothetical protein
MLSGAQVKNGLTAPISGPIWREGPL